MENWEKAMAPHSSTLAWKTPWTEEPARLQSMGSRRVGHELVTSLSLFTFMHWRRKWQPTPEFLPENPRDGGACGLPSMGSHRVGYDWSDLAATAAAAQSCKLNSLWLQHASSSYPFYTWYCICVSPKLPVVSGSFLPPLSPPQPVSTQLFSTRKYQSLMLTSGVCQE